MTAPEPLPDGNATSPSSPATSEHQHEFLPAHFRGDAHRHARRHAAGGFGRQAGARANDRRDEAVEGEDRRGRKARQHDDRLAVHDGEAQRLAGFERNAMHQDAGLAEPRDDAVREIARAFRGAAGEHHHVVLGERLAHRLVERDFVIAARRRRRVGAPPASVTAAAMIAPLLS